MLYDLIIVGAGAAGLFAGASLPTPVNGLILEKGSRVGRKLLMTGGGQCNLTHAGSIKDFPAHYGKAGSRIRTILYRFSNEAVMDFFTAKGVPVTEREDGKVFPESLMARDVAEVLVRSCKENGLKFICDSAVTAVTIEKGTQDADAFETHVSPVYAVCCSEQKYRTRKLIIATGGCSYPTTGSTGSFFPVLEGLGFEMDSLRPALVPIYPQNYPYRELAGIAFAEARISILSSEASAGGSRKIAETTDALLLTHDCFSGPAILNSSRYASVGNEISIHYFPSKTAELILKELKTVLPGNPKTLRTVLYEYFNEEPAKSPADMPKRFLEVICSRAGADPTQKASQTTGSAMKSIVRLLTDDRHCIKAIGDFNVAMVTAGGISLSEADLKTMEAKKHPNLYFAGEALAVDGDTGGYNLQFAFSSGYLAAQQCQLTTDNEKEIPR